MQVARTKKKKYLDQLGEPRFKGFAIDVDVMFEGLDEGIRRAKRGKQREG